VGRRTGMPRTRKGRGQADLRRGKAGTSPQHRTKSPIRHMVELRISDDRALKVAGVYPGRPAASRWGWRLKITGNRDNRSTKSPASVEHRVLAADELNLTWRGAQRQGCAGRQTSE
jgi:hypothetical protein